MGVVFEARHVRLGQRVAIKVLGSELREFPELVQRFEREARACGALSSRHAVRVFDIDATEDGTPFIVMELLDGRDLGHVVEKEGPQPVAQSVGWILEACDAISEAHGLGIVHRDIKPSNLFLAEVDGQTVVKVLDFGIAKRVAKQEVAITHALAPLGTPAYMSPEQVRSAKEVDGRSDVWSLGVTLYELVTGHTPFGHESSSACIAAIAADPVPDPRTYCPELDANFVAVLLRALEKNVQDRYASVDELMAALAPFALSDGISDGVSVSTVAKPVVARRTVERVETLRAHAESTSDRTIPPAIWIAPVPAKRKLRSSLVMASAAVIGIAAVFLAPRFVGEGVGEGVAPTVHASMQMAAATLPPAAVVAPAVAPVAPAVLDTPVAVETPTAASAEPVVAIAQAAPAAPLATARTAAVATAAAQPSSLHVRPRNPDAKPAKPTSVAVRPDVHGGLSNPGF